MQLTLCGQTALMALRILRARGTNLATCKRCELLPPQRDGRRWSRKEISAFLKKCGWDALTQGGPLQIVVPDSARRLQLKDVHCSTWGASLPPASFLHIADGLAISCPELVFAEMGTVMDPVVQLLLGMEFTGTFSRDASHPRTGAITYQLPPTSTLTSMRLYLDKLKNLRGLDQSRWTLDQVVENTWSPMEAVIAALLVLPQHQLGYDLSPIVCNRRVTPGEGRPMPSGASSRVPDIVFPGTSVGLNYDGDDHFGLQAIAEAGIRLGSNPGDHTSARELERALSDARRAIVADKQRDRDLAAQGLTIMPVTWEDLLKPGGLDTVVMALIQALTREGRRVPAQQEAFLAESILAQMRQDLIWSLVPGPRAAEAWARLAHGPSERERKLGIALWEVMGFPAPVFVSSVM